MMAMLLDWGQGIPTRTVSPVGSSTSRQCGTACREGHGRSRHGRFFFCWPDRRHLNPDWRSHDDVRMCRDADVPVIRLQDARHTHASLMLASGEHPRIVQERLGWATVSFMLETYSHLLPGMQRGAANRFAARELRDRHRAVQ
jgi:integrase